jgi:hypothetical protein
METLDLRLLDDVGTLKTLGTLAYGLNALYGMRWT